MMRDPVSSVVDPTRGGMSGNTGRYEKRLSDLSGLYADESAFQTLLKERGDSVVYDVEDFRPGTHSGDLIYGVTRMSPGRIGGEFFLTRGHIHEKADRPEIYYGQKGLGLMQLESPPARPGSSKSAHRPSATYRPFGFTVRSISARKTW